MRLFPVMIVISVFAITELSAQSVGINFNGSQPNSSAALDINVSGLAGKKKGLLIPRMNEADRIAMNPLPAAAQGLTVYQTDGVQGFYYNISVTTLPNWVYISPGGVSGVRWDQITAPANNLTLAHGANKTALSFDGVTADTAFSMTANGLSTGSLLKLSSNSTSGAASSNSAILSILRSGVNANNNHDAVGMYALVTNTGVGGFNAAGYFSASGAITNFGLYGNVTGANGANYGVYGKNSSGTPTLQTGVSGIAVGNMGFAGNATGVFGSATAQAAINVGGDFTANQGATANYAVRGRTVANGGIGVYGENFATGAGEQYGIIGTKSGNTATGIGYGVYGSATGTGSNSFGGYFVASGATVNQAVHAETNGDGGIGMYGENNSLGSNFKQIGIYGTKTGNTGAGLGYGVYGSASGTGNANTGGEFFATGGGDNYGVHVSAMGTNANNYGGYFTASGASLNEAIHAETSGEGGYGIFCVNNSTGVSNTQIGIYGAKTGNTVGGVGYGMYGSATGSGNTNAGGQFSASGAANDYGIFATASGTNTLSIGGLFSASGSSANTYAVYAQTNANNGIGAYGQNNSTGAGTQIGVKGAKTANTPSGMGYGVSGSATGAANLNAGGDFTASGALFNYGITANATGAGTNYGGYFSAVGGTNNYAAIFSNGNVGIGTSTPLTTLHVKGTVNVFGGASSTHGGLFWLGTSTVDGVEIVTTPGGDAYVGIQRTGNAGLNLSMASGSGVLAAFNVGGVTVGTISTDGSTTFYNTTSDNRLKENIEPSKTGLNMLMKMNVDDYNYKADPNKKLQTGFLAQELYKIFPQAVHAGGDDAKTNPWTIDYSKLTPVLVKGIQEQQLLVDGLQKQNEQMAAKMELLEKQLAEATAEIKKLMH